MHMKAGSILSAWLNFWMWIISFRIFGYVSLYPLRYDKNVSYDMDPGLAIRRIEQNASSFHMHQFAL